MYRPLGIDPDVVCPDAFRGFHGSCEIVHDDRGSQLVFDAIRGIGCVHLGWRD
jgi:hypothetical protein